MTKIAYPTQQETTAVPAGYAAVAQALDEIAQTLRQLAATTPDLPDPPYVQLDIQPGRPGGAGTARLVDTVAAALCGRAATTRHLGGGAWHRSADGVRGPVNISVYGSVPAPAAGGGEPGE